MVYGAAGPENTATVIVIPRLTGGSTNTVRVVTVEERICIIVRTIRALPGLSPFS